MTDHNFRKVNFAHSRSRKGFSKKINFILALFSIFVIGIFLWSLKSQTTSVFNYAVPAVFQTNPLKSTDDRVNVLLLGNAGGTHDGAELTDSIIVASYNLKTNKATLISIPRDLWVSETRSKINALFEIGELKKNGANGLKFAEGKIDDLVGLPIHYGVRIDFDGFARAIDHVEGVDVDVPKTFDDYLYPITGKEKDLCGLTEKEVELTEEQIKALNLPPDKQILKPGKNEHGSTTYKVLVDVTDKIATSSADFSCRFEHLHFDKGPMHMDGTIALKFVRSRQGTNGEGSDFARSRRQQLVLQAFRSKALSIKTLTNPKTVLDLVQTFGLSFETDIPADKYLEFYNLSKKMGSVNNIVLGDLGPGKSILITPPPTDYGGAYVLTPPNDDFSRVHEFIKSELNKDR